MRRRPSARTAALVVLLAGLVAGCSSNGTTISGPPAQHVGTADTYLAVDGLLAFPTTQSTTSNVAVLAAALPAWATSYETIALAGTDEFEALSHGADVAKSIHPTVVTVSMGMGSLFSGVSSTQFGNALGQLLAQLRASGATTILVGNLLPADLSKPALACLGRTNCSLAPDEVTWTAGQLAGEITAYNEAIAGEAATHGATVVDVHGAVETAIDRRGAGAVWARSSYELTPYGSSVVTSSFLQAIRDRPLNRQGTRAG